MKVSYILSNIDKAVAFEWVAEELAKREVRLNFILIASTKGHLYHYLKERSVEVDFISYKGKKDIIRVFLKLLSLLAKKRVEVVHTHLFEASLLGLLAARLLNIPKRIYTRHHGTYHHDYFPKAVKWDKLINRLSTHIVAISKNVEQIVIKLENVDPSKIRIIHHGFKVESFRNVPKEKVERLKAKYKINGSPIVGVISRYIDWKGIKYIIEAYKKYLEQYPNSLLVLANASGSNEKEIKEHLNKSLKTDQFVEIKFEEDLFALYQLFDFFVHVPVDDKIEAFGQTYIEALASGIPSIFTLSGVANEFVVNNHNAIVVDYKSSESIYNALLKYSNTPALKQKVTMNGYQDIQAFNLKNFIDNLMNLYDE